MTLISTISVSLTIISLIGSITGASFSSTVKLLLFKAKALFVPSEHLTFHM